MLPRGRAGVTGLNAGASFARPSQPTLGNSLPPWTGSPAGPADRPAPAPPGQFVGGQTGDTDGNNGADPAAPKMSPSPWSTRVGAWGEGDAGTTQQTQSFRRFGLQGFNDQLQLRDRHAYWDAGHMRQGVTPSVPGNPPNPVTDGPPRPDLRIVNRSVNPQIGSDNSRNQDDLSRPYTWLGQQDGTVQSVYGGVPGLYQPYGTRGGVPLAIHDPTDGQGGPVLVRSGPPHGLHSDTLPSGKQVADRYKVTPQMRPVRLDRPDNSRVAGQSFSQTVPAQGQAATAAAHTPRHGPGVSFRVSGRGWAGGAK